LTVAVVVLFIVFITLLMKLNPSTETKETPETNIKVERPKPVAPAKIEFFHPKKDCPHHMGYLSTLAKNTPIPDECFGCKKIVVCFLNVKGQREDKNPRSENR